MRVRIVGCGDAFGTGGRDSSCYHVEAKGFRFTLDFGFSAHVAMKRAGLSLAALDAVALSHLHGDHFGGLPALLIDGQFGELREKPLAIFGPPGTAQRLKAAMDALYPDTWNVKWRFPFAIEEVAPGASVPFGPLTLTTAEVAHPSGAPSTALRVTGGAATLAFSGDTQWTEALCPIAYGADLFICECFKFQGMPYGHLSYETLARERQALGAKRILLTHMGEEMLERRSEVDGAAFMLAEDGLVFDL